MYIEASSPHQPSDDAKLCSPPLKFFGIMCLEFYYYMSGANTASLNVTINKTVVFSASGDRGDVWYKASINISSIVGSHTVSIIIKELMEKGNDFERHKAGICVYFLFVRGFESKSREDLGYSTNIWV